MTLDFNAGKFEKSIGTESDLLAVQTKDGSSLYFPTIDVENFDVSTSLGTDQDNSDFYGCCCEFFSEMCSEVICQYHIGYEFMQCLIFFFMF